MKMNIKIATAIVALTVFASVAPSAEGKVENKMKYTHSEVVAEELPQVEKREIFNFLQFDLSDLGEVWGSELYADREGDGGNYIVRVKDHYGKELARFRSLADGTVTRLEKADPNMEEIYMASLALGSAIEEDWLKKGPMGQYRHWYIKHDGSDREYLMMDNFERKKIGKNTFNPEIGRQYYTTVPENKWFYDYITPTHLAMIEDFMDLKTWHHNAEVGLDGTIKLDGRVLKMDLKEVMAARRTGMKNAFVELDDNGNMLITLLGGDETTPQQSWVVLDGKVTKLKEGYSWDFVNHREFYNPVRYMISGMLEMTAGGGFEARDVRPVALVDKSGEHYMYRTYIETEMIDGIQNEFVLDLIDSLPETEGYVYEVDLGEFAVVDGKCIGDAAPMKAWYDEPSNSFMWITNEDDGTKLYEYRYRIDPTVKVKHTWSWKVKIPITSCR